MIIKLGVIGTGNMGRNHVRIARELNNCFQLVSVFDPDRSRVESLGLLDIAAESVESLIDKVDAVIIAAPSSLHKDLALEVAKQKKHLLVEKPLALSSEDAKTIVGAFESTGKTLMVGDRKSVV